jgi:ligand-binding sensor domain-containing protein/signal transduction histidine kinase
MRVGPAQLCRVNFSVVMACALFLCSAARSGQSQGYADQFWKVSDGLPNSQVRGIAQTPNGLLWVGTLEGLATFDGLTFSTVEPRSLREMIKQHYIGLAVGRDSSVWFSNGQGLSRHHDGKTSYYSISNGLPSAHVLAVFCDSAGEIIAATEKGVRKLKDGIFVPLATDDPIGSTAVRAVLQDEQGSLWFGCTNGLLKLENGQFVRGTKEQGAFPVNSVLALARGTNGVIWVGTSAGLTRIDVNGSTNFTMAHGLLTNAVRSLCQGKDGTLWVGSPAGLQRLEMGQLPLITQVNTFAAEYDWAREYVFSIFEDEEENIWVGTNHGLMRYKRERFKVYSAREGLPSRLVNTVMEDRRGRVWVGTAAGIARIEDNRVVAGLAATNENQPAQFPKIAVLSLLEDDQGDVWFGTRSGVYRMTTNLLFHYTAKQSNLADDVARSIVQLNAESHWIGNSNGLTRYRFQLFTNFAAEAGLPFTGVRALAEGKGKRLWVGSEEGLTMLEENKYKRYTLSDGLSSERINALYVDSDDTVWIGTENGGLDRFRNGHFSAITPAASGLFSERIYSIVEDNHSNLWMGCRRGIFRARKADLNAFADGRIKAVNCVAYGKDDGLRSIQCTGNSQPAAWKGQDGRLWFATVDGVAAIDANNLIVNRTPPKVSLQRILVDGRTAGAGQEMKFSPGRGNVQFEYSGICLQAPEKVSFQYQLKGVDADWVDAGRHRLATYANLRPGAYDFLIRARNNDGFWTPSPASYPFTLTPHFYQRSSFYAGVIGLLAVGIYGLHLSRVRRHELQKRELAALVTQRTEHLEAAIKSMQAFTYSMAHDLRAPVRSIRQLTSLWIDEYRDRFDPNALNYAERIEASAKRMQELMQDLLDYGLVAHASTTVEKVNLQRTFESIRSELQTEVEAKHGAIETKGEAGDVVANPLLLRQALTNLVTNALKFVPPQTNPLVQLRTERRKDCVRICVEDNGIGIPTKYRERIFGLFERLDSDKKYPGTGVGLAIVQKAVERMGGKVGVESEPGKGSCFWVDLPAA